MFMEGLVSILATAPQGIDVNGLSSLLGKAVIDRGIHLAILVEPYLQYIVEGRKTIESRFSRNKTAPWKRVRRGDVILLKRSGGPIVGYCEVSEVMYFQLDPGVLERIKDEHGREICAPDEFWKDKEKSSYATLLRIKNVIQLSTGIMLKKNDQRAWIVLRDKQVTSLDTALKSSITPV